MEGVQNLPPHMQGEFMKTLEQMQIKDSLMWDSFFMLSRDTVYATYFDRRIRISTPHVSMGTSGARACMSGIIELGDVHMPTIL